MIYNKTMNTKLCNSCAIHIELFVIYLIINISISRVFIYFCWYLKKKTIFVLILILILKQQFIRYIYINGEYQRNKHKKSNLLIF